MWCTVSDADVREYSYDGRIDWGVAMAQPRYTLITGDFYILYPDLPQNGPEPDGDTVNFLPDQDSLIQNLQRFSDKRPDRRHLGTYGVRFEGIDTGAERLAHRRPFRVAARFAWPPPPAGGVGRSTATNSLASAAAGRHAELAAQPRRRA